MAYNDQLPLYLVFVLRQQLVSCNYLERFLFDDTKCKLNLVPSDIHERNMLSSGELHSYSCHMMAVIPLSTTFVLVLTGNMREY